MKVNEKLNFYETETMNEIEAMYITFTYPLLSISIATPVEWTSFYQIFSLCFSFKSYYFVASTYIMAHCLDALWIVSWLHWFDFFFCSECVPFNIAGFTIKTANSGKAEKPTKSVTLFNFLWSPSQIDVQHSTFF